MGLSKGKIATDLLLTQNPFNFYTLIRLAVGGEQYRSRISGLEIERGKQEASL